MPSGKKTPSRSPGSGASQANAPASLSFPTLPIPDFDPTEFQRLCAEAEAAAKEGVKAFAAMQAACDETRNQGALEALAQGERAAAAAEAVSVASNSWQRWLTLLNNWKSAYDIWHAGERRSRRMRFEQLSQSCNWTITGTWPEPVLNRIVFLTIDELKDKAAVNGRPVAGLPTAERLARAVADEITTLQQQLTQPEAFISQLWKAYSARTQHPQTGVQVLELIAEMTWQRQSKAFQRDPRSEFYRGYSLAQFRADLTHYLASGAPAVSSGGKSLELHIAGGSFAQDGIYMYFPQTDRLATCGRLTFQPVA